MSNQIRQACIQLIGLLSILVFTISAVQSQSGRNPYRPADGLQAGLSAGNLARY